MKVTVNFTQKEAEAALEALLASPAGKDAVYGDLPPASEAQRAAAKLEKALNNRKEKTHVSA